MKHADWQPKPHPVPRPRHRRLGPSIPRTLLWGLRKKCPACGQGRIFRGWFTIRERCPRCGLKFERIDGHWIGAIGTNTVVTFAVILILLVISLIMFVNSDLPRWYIAVGLVAVGGSVPPLLDPFTRTFWTAIDIAMRPLEAYEVDWTVVDPSGIEPSPAPIESGEAGNTFRSDATTSPSTKDEPRKVHDHEQILRNEEP